jgi:L-iditol 2-dehydrogenase
MDKMKALVIRGDKDLDCEMIEIPVCQEDEVLIKVQACGICGSDVPRALDGGVHYYPIVLGHEFSGDIVKIGNAVDNAKIGDRVTAAPLLPCSKCSYCQMGHPAMCESYGFVGSRQYGAMAEYVAIKAANVIKLPDEVDYISGAMIEPITVALHGIDRISFKAGAAIAVFGAGTIGLLTLQCLKALGAGLVYVIDIVPEKLEMAKQLGADVVVNAMEHEPVNFIKDRGAPQVVFETAGSSVTQRQSLEVVARLGKVVFIGTATQDLALSPDTFEKILRGELEVTGSWMSYSAPYPGYEWATAAQYLKEGKIKTEKLVTHVFKLENGLQAFQTMKDKTAGAIKIMFTI